MALINVSPNPKSPLFIAAESIVALNEYQGKLALIVRGSEDDPLLSPFPAEWTDDQRRSFVWSIAARINASR